MYVEEIKPCEDRWTHCSVAESGTDCTLKHLRSRAEVPIGDMEMVAAYYIEVISSSACTLFLFPSAGYIVHIYPNLTVLNQEFVVVTIASCELLIISSWVSFTC